MLFVVEPKVCKCPSPSPSRLDIRLPVVSLEFPTPRSIYHWPQQLRCMEKKVSNSSFIGSNMLSMRNASYMISVYHF